MTVAALPPAAIADPPSETLPADNYTVNTGGIALGEAAIARAENSSAGYIFDGTTWRPLR